MLLGQENFFFQFLFFSKWYRALRSSFIFELKLGISWCPDTREKGYSELDAILGHFGWIYLSSSRKGILIIMNAWVELLSLILTGKFWLNLFGLVLGHFTPDRKYFYICIIYRFSSFQWYLNDSSIPLFSGRNQRSTIKTFMRHY